MIKHPEYRTRANNHKDSNNSQGTKDSKITSKHQENTIIRGMSLEVESNRKWGSRDNRFSKKETGLLIGYNKIVDRISNSTLITSKDVINTKTTNTTKPLEFQIKDKICKTRHNNNINNRTNKDRDHRVKAGDNNRMIDNMTTNMITEDLSNKETYNKTKEGTRIK